MQYTASELNKTNQILMELPLFQNLLTENEELEEQVRMLKHNIMYFESANRKMLRKVEKLKMEIKSMKKKSKKSKVVEETSAATLEEDDDEVVFIKQEKIFKSVSNNTIVIDLCNDDEPAIKMVIEEPVDEDNEGDNETSAGSDSCKATLDEVVEIEEEEEVVEEETEEVVEVEGDEETEEVVEVEGEGEGEDETSAGSDSCKATLEEVVEVEGEEEDVYEIEINGKTYYVSNEKNSVIYAADEDGEITIEAGVYKNGKPIFN